MSLHIIKRLGFCVSDIKKKFIKKYYKKNDLFKIDIQSSFKKKGKLHYGEAVIPGKSKKRNIDINLYLSSFNSE